MNGHKLLFGLYVFVFIDDFVILNLPNFTADYDHSLDQKRKHTIK